jgi:3-phosphoshikimate 1-carboxyvinyltransferase
VTVSGGVLRAFDFDVSSCPDLFPVLAVLAAGAKGESRLFGGKRLRLKESDRIRTTADLLISLGGDVTELEDGLLIRGGKRLLGGTVDGAGDHRIVMAAAVARAIAGGDIEILGAGAVTKSYPGFFGDLARLKGASHEIGIR